MEADTCSVAAGDGGGGGLLLVTDRVREGEKERAERKIERWRKAIDRRVQNSPPTPHTPTGVNVTACLSQHLHQHTHTHTGRHAHTHSHTHLPSHLVLDLETHKPSRKAFLTHQTDTFKRNVRVHKHTHQEREGEREKVWERKRSVRCACFI